jgi:hypothetical protein
VTKTKALIGSTGFIGQNLMDQISFDAQFNSKNIFEISNKYYDTVVCAGVSAVKWFANQNPDADRLHVQAAAEEFVKVRCGRFILISTVDVYDSRIEVNEFTQPNKGCLEPYGLHRFWLEEQLKSTLENLTIIRLPGLFGPYLKKNLLFDITTGKLKPENVDQSSIFQWYPVSNLWRDIEIIIEKNINIINLVPEPLPTRRILTHFFNVNTPPSDGNGKSPRYDIHTLHSKAFSSKIDNYILSESEVMTAIGKWLQIFPMRALKSTPK